MFLHTTLYVLYIKYLLPHAVTKIVLVAPGYKCRLLIRPLQLNSIMFLEPDRPSFSMRKMLSLEVKQAPDTQCACAYRKLKISTQILCHFIAFFHLQAELPTLSSGGVIPRNIINLKWP